MASDSAGSVPNQPDPAPGEARPGLHRSPAARQAAARSRRGSWRAWRRSRPFWGGLLLLLAGLEMLLIPLSGVLVHGQIKLVIYVGIGGVFGILIGALLIACGLALWFSPALKTFYSIAGVLLAILSFIGTNLGGFFIGMLLGIIGGALAFAWTPAPAESARDDESAPRPPREPRSEGIGLALGEPRPDDDTLTYNRPGNNAHDSTAPPADRFPGDRDTGRREPRRDPGAGSATGPRHRGRSGGRVMVLVAMSVLLGGSLLAGRASAAVAAPAQAQQGQGCILLIFCSPSQSPSPSAPAAPSSPAPGSSGGTGTAPGTAPSPGGSIIGGLLPGATPSAGSGSATKKNGKKPASKKADPTAGLVVCTSPTVLTAASATLTGFAYQGVVNMPVAGGGTVQMMKFTLTSQSLSSATQTVTETGRTLTTKLAAATFSGNVVLYATKLSGNLGAIPLALTPGNAVSTLLQLLKTLTPALPLTLTNVTANQPVLLAGSTVIRGLGVSAS
jgi:hypothetical protein